MQHLQNTGGHATGSRISTWTHDRGGEHLLTASSADPYPPAPPYRGFLSRRNRPARRRAVSPVPSASATSAGTGTGALFLNLPPALSLAPVSPLLYRHAAKNIPKAAATNGWPSPS